jgi:predicted PurR-regulated permease PerM
MSLQMSEDERFDAVSKILRTERRTRLALVLLIIVGFLMFVAVVIFTIYSDQHINTVITANHVKTEAQAHSASSYIANALEQIRALFQKEFSNIRCSFAGSKTDPTFTCHATAS